MSFRRDVIGFADDLALMVVAKETKEVETKANNAIKCISAWIADSGLDLAAHKTEAVLFTSRKTVEHITIQVYLGVMLDNRLSYGAHVDYVTKKSAGVHGALSRMLPSIGGPKEGRRRLLASVVRSVQ
ncbi:hypothetical protein KR067_000794, partial [Drosophila pandora]